MGTPRTAAAVVRGVRIVVVMVALQGGTPRKGPLRGKDDDDLNQGWR
ncbi:MAG TPA: hypothetical protein VGR68_11980 [Actinomycetota bacterium]|nr:hypothetical protein [Actinomycetota bacterium]